MVFETPVLSTFNHLTQLEARENFIKVIQLFKKIPAFYVNRRFITMFTRASFVLLINHFHRATC
jgi:hypothetical protein